MELSFFYFGHLIIQLTVLKNVENYSVLCYTILVKMGLLYLGLQHNMDYVTQGRA